MPELGQERVSEAARSAAEACTRRGAARPGAAAEGSQAACKQRRLGAQAAPPQARPRAGARGCRGAARQLLRPGRLRGRMRVCAWVWTCVGRAGASPCVARTPPGCSCVCSADQPCLCSYAARARPPPTRARPRQENPPHPPGPWRRRRLRNTAACPPPERTVVTAETGLRDRAQAWEARGGAGEMQELGAGTPSASSSVHRKVAMEAVPALGVWRQKCRGGRELGQVQWRPRVLREGGLPSPRAPWRCGRTSDLSSISPPLHSGALRPAELPPRLTVCRVW